MNSLDGKLYAKIRREAKKQGIKIQKCEYYPGIRSSYWRVGFHKNRTDYTYQGYLWEVGLRLGLITEGDVREARGRTEIPLKLPQGPFWAMTMGWGRGLYPSQLSESRGLA